MKSIKIHDKDYFPVVERVKELRTNEKYKGFAIDTEIVQQDDDSVTIKARIYDGENLVSSGIANERRSWSKINAKSMVENCETSAVGRALAFLNIGVTDDIASAEEMKDVEETHDASYAQISMIEQLLPSANIDEKLRKGIEVEYIGFSQQRAQKCITFLKENNANDSLDNQLDDKLKDEKQ